MTLSPMTTVIIAAARTAGLSSTCSRFDDATTSLCNEPWFFCFRLARCACMFVLIVLSAAFATGAEFIPLGGGFHSEANAISDDGSVVVGMNSVAGFFFEPFRWTQETGMESIAGQLQGIDAYASDVSRDGSVVVGADFDGTLFRWFDGGTMELLGDNTAWEPSASADASVIVGRALEDGKVEDDKVQATRWTKVDGRTVIGLPESESNASDISDDGTLVVGTTSFPEPGFKRPGVPFLGKSFVWSEQDGHQLLGGLPGVDLGSIAWAISPDGSAVVGVAKTSDWPATEPFMWTKPTGMVGLGLLPDRGHGMALDVSTRGSVVVGYSADVDDHRDSSKDQAFIWDKVNGMRSLQTVLEDNGLAEALSEWELTSAKAISADGLHIAGTGLNPFGDFEAWLVHLDSPLFAVALQAGDADQDMDFDQLDLVRVQQSAKYLTGQLATWGEGDWNGAPGGSVGSPPPGDGVFDQLDIVSALATGLYLTGPYAALVPNGSENDGQASVVYMAGSGAVSVDAPAGTELTSINLESAAGIFTGQPALNLGGSFDNDADNNVFKATFGGSFGSLSFGNIAKPELSEQFVLNDLSVAGSFQGGGALGDVDLIYIPVPEPPTIVLLGLAATVIVWTNRSLQSTFPESKGTTGLLL